MRRVRMVKPDSLAVPLQTKGVWRYATTDSGGRCVTEAGDSAMQPWCVENRGTHLKVVTTPTLSCVCRCVHVLQCMFFHPAGALPVYYGDFGQGTGVIYLSAVNCRGTEESLDDCSTSDPIGHNYCVHSIDAGVICFGKYLANYVTSLLILLLLLLLLLLLDPNNTCTNGDLRLVDGETANEGRLQVCFRNHWGTICDDDFGATEASLVCRTLNFSSEGT